MHRFSGLLASFVFIASSAMATTAYNASLGGPGCYTGTGCDNAGFTVSTDNGVELALGPIIRFVGHIDGTPDNFYEAPLGTLGLYAKWGINFSVNTGSGFLGDYTYVLSTTNLLNSTSGTSFDPVRDIPDNSYYGAGGESMTQDLATQFGAQNTTNLAFAGVFPGFDPNVPGFYLISLAAYDGPTLINQVDVYVDAGFSVPEPGSLVSMASALTLLGLLAWRRRRAS